LHDCQIARGLSAPILPMIGSDWPSTAITVQTNANSRCLPH
jgi:hypothetical protein